MTNKDKILNKIKDVLKAHTFCEITTWLYLGMAEDLKSDNEIARAYSEIVPCNKCEFKEECDKETDMRGSYECYGMIRKKLREDEEKMEEQEVKEDEEKTEKLVKEIPTNDWYEKEIYELRAKVNHLEFEKELLLIQLIILTENDPKKCYQEEEQ